MSGSGGLPYQFCCCLCAVCVEGEADACAQVGRCNRTKVVALVYKELHGMARMILDSKAFA